jgi:hypothetical protein
LFLAIVMQKPPHPRDASRREFVRAGFRYALLTGLAAVSAVLFKRGGGKLSGQTCSNQGICGGCGAFTNCGLPQALSAKEFQLQNRHHKEAA